jgi:hypothetical protein
MHMACGQTKILRQACTALIKKLNNAARNALLPQASNASRAHDVTFERAKRI